jgi:ribosome biogenesis GTPase / thiamine phosphate phosphatase
MTATVIAVYGRQYLVRDTKGQQHRVASLGRQNAIAVGDEVQLRDADSANVVLQKVLERRNILFRSDAFKEKLLAANIDQVLVVISGKPLFSEEHLMRAAIAADCASIPLILVCNKSDLPETQGRARERTAVWAALGYQVVEISVKAAPEATIASMHDLVAGKRSLLIGQSGMGKSSLLNLLIPSAQQHTREISLALNTGKQTTTFTQAFPLEGGPCGSLGGELIDSPGFQEFGLHHVSRSQLQHALPELHERLGQCKYNNCLHLQEPGCAVTSARNAGDIDATRYDIYVRILSTLEQSRQ